MSDLQPDDLDKEQIREAEPEQVDEWICIARDLRYELFDRWEYQWTEAGCPGLLEHGETESPIPFTSAWWAAGPLLEELQAAASEIGGTVGASLKMSPPTAGIFRWKAARYKATAETAQGDTAPEAIARAWLIAWSCGLVGGGDE